jgi:hypothetical protein
MPADVEKISRKVISRCLVVGLILFLIIFIAAIFLSDIYIAKLWVIAESSVVIYAALCVIYAFLEGAKIISKSKK